MVVISFFYFYLLFFAPPSPFRCFLTLLFLQERSNVNLLSNPMFIRNTQWPVSKSGCRLESRWVSLRPIILAFLPFYFFLYSLWGFQWGGDLRLSSKILALLQLSVNLFQLRLNKKLKINFFCFKELNINKPVFFVSLRKIKILGSSRDEISYSFETF